MAAVPGDDSDLNFSGSDSDDNDNNIPPPQRRALIAHKDISRYMKNQPKIKNMTESNDFDSGSPIVCDDEDDDNDVSDKKKDESTDNEDEPSFEPISPEEKFEAISPPASPKDSNVQFENISDDEDDKKQSKEEVSPEGKFSPVPSDNELNFDDESSNDSGYQIVKPVKPVVVQNPEPETEDHAKKSIETENGKDEVEAPLPSPISDIDDSTDMRDAEDSINDILSSPSETNDQGFVIETVEDLSNHKQNEADDKQNVPDTEEEQLPTKTSENDSKMNYNVTIDDNNQNNSEVNEKEKSQETPYKDGANEDRPEENEKGDKPDVRSTIGGKLATEADEQKEKILAGEQDKLTGEEDDNDEDLIADIFGDSDEEQEFAGFDEEEEEGEEEEEKKREQLEPVVDKVQGRDDESSDDEMPQEKQESDFDVMMRRRKEMNRQKRRSKKDFDIINDNDDIIAAMIRQMKDAAEEDRILNQCGKAATKKMKLLPVISRQLKKADLQSAFIDCGILPALKDWLTPLPDHSLPHVNIRKTFLRMLLEFPPLDKSALKVSGIGRAVMLLFKHPKETVENKRMAGKIISVWARPIFNVSSNFNDMSREDREDRDKANLPEAKRRRLSSGVESNKNTLDDESDTKPRKPGDKGWIGRARVPMPSHRDYVNRPQSKVDYDPVPKGSKKELSRYEKQMRKLKDKRAMLGGTKKAVDVSLNGSKLSL